MKIIQLIECLSYGDGMGNHTILTHRLLKQAGYHVETYAGKILPNVPKGIAQLFSDDLKVEPKDIILLQFGIGGHVPECVAGFACRKILVYHNVTPSHFFVGYDYTAYKATADGHRLVKYWAEAQAFDAVLAFSQYNFRELISLGFSQENTFYFPGYLMPLWEYNKNPDLDTLDDFKDGQTNILFVGRISPNKKQQDILRAFAYYQENIDRNARLILLGGGEGSAYGKALKEYIKDLDIKNVIFPGHSSMASLIALYMCADVFLCMSEHEGFCIPLVEAMIFDVPILAYNASAVPDTLNGSGVLLNDKDPVLVAKWIERIVNDKNLRDSILVEQRKQLKEFDQTAAGQEMLNFLGKFIDEKINKYQCIDAEGEHECDIGALIDDSLYNIISMNLECIGKRMPMSREEYLSSIHKQ